MKTLGIFLLLLMLFPACIHAQEKDSSNWVKYTRKFEFNKGIYLNFESFKENNPLPEKRIISSIDPMKAGYYRKLVTQPKLNYLNEKGDTVTIPAQSVWGYSDENGIYILPKKFLTAMSIDSQSVQIQKTILPQKLIIIGEISAYYEIDSVIVQDLQPVVMGNSFSGANSNITYVSSSRTKEKLIPYVMDYQTGLISLFDIERFERKLKQDPELYKEYKKEGGNKKRKAWLFIFRYNEKYPIYFPRSH